MNTPDFRLLDTDTIDLDRETGRYYRRIYRIRGEHPPTRRDFIGFERLTPEEVILLERHPTRAQIRSMLAHPVHAQ